jgi:hypothetical protein
MIKHASQAKETWYKSIKKNVLSMMVYIDVPKLFLTIYIFIRPYKQHQILIFVKEQAQVKEGL